MYIIRPILLSDYQAYVDLAFAAKLGMLTMPKNPELLKQYLHNSVTTFLGQRSDESFYLFVLENTETKEIGGVSGIYTHIGMNSPRHYYRMENVDLQPYGSLPIVKQLHVLKPIAVSRGPSEICSLFLAPHFRKEGLGKLLSLSRFLFIANFSDWFEQEIIAEMRGYVNNDNTNAFWDCVGRNFLNISYPELIQTQHQGMEFIPHIIPEYPIYLELLPPQAQEVIGKVHDNTCPALKMLQNEGFAPCGLYDLFDAGPLIKAETKKIRTIAERQTVVMEGATMHPMVSPFYIISNDKIDFRACLSPLNFTTPTSATLPINIAQELNLQLGDTFSYILP
jgi:arginine N-succinyltransferase